MPEEYYEGNGFDTTLSDLEIEEFIDEVKLVKSKDLDTLKHPTQKIAGHLRGKIVVFGQSKNRYEVMVRVNPRIPGDFSVILCYRPLNYDKGVNLKRYNGNSHIHTNKLEGNIIVRKCHIHTATERYQSKGHKAEDYAEETVLYSTFQEAIDIMVDECRIRIEQTGSLFDYGGR